MSETTSASRRTVARRGFVAAVLVVLGLGLWAVYRISAGSEQHSYAKGIAPTYVQLVRGHTYTIDLRGGVPAESALRVSPASLSCEVTTPGAQSIQLAVAPEEAGTKATNQIATFVAPRSGMLHLECAGLPAVFVDDAANASYDWSGVWLVLASACLLVGLPLALSVARLALSAPRREDEDDAEPVSVE